MTMRDINDPMLSQYRVDQNITTEKTHNEDTRQSVTQTQSGDIQIS